MKIAINSKVLDTSSMANAIIGSGGEADVYDVGGGRVLKVYKDLSHPDVKMATLQERKAIAQKLQAIQVKLKKFPVGLPQEVVGPIELAIKVPDGTVAGYTMPFVKGAELLRRYGEKDFRLKFCGQQQATDVLLAISRALRKIHDGGVVIGDFNDLNVLVKNSTPYFIDADSYQYGGFVCTTYTDRFVDPLLCSFDKSVGALVLSQYHNKDSDWYAFAVMVMQSLLFLAYGPYGGVYKPKDKSKIITRAERPLKRVTVFDNEVVYPAPAIHYRVLPDSLLDYFYNAFLKDRRTDLPDSLLDLEWRKCACGVEHARSVCPSCQHQAVAPVDTSKVVIIKGGVKKTVLFKDSSANILFATVQQNAPRWIYAKKGEVRRENGSVIFAGSISPGMRLRIMGTSTLVSMGNQVVDIGVDNTKESFVADLYREKFAAFDANATHRFWIKNGMLMRSDEYAPVAIGQLLANQTMFWVGEAHGVGFYRAGNFSVGFVFDTKKNVINDSLQFPQIGGQIVSAKAVFSSQCVWILLSYVKKSVVVNYCCQYGFDGKLIGSFETEDGEDNWLGSISGKTAVGGILFSATDRGIVRVEPSGSVLKEVAQFSGTDSFVDSGSHILASSDGIYVVSGNEVSVVQMR